MAPATSLSTSKAIRSHRKSRTGCGTCKRRKVKCDEEKPCSKCVGFGLPCDLVPESACLEYGTAPVPRRGRGRPRKIWTTAANTTKTASPLSRSIPAPGASTPGVYLPPVNAEYAELLLHFITVTAATFGGHDCSRIRTFWMRNVPHIGLSHGFVLHLTLAVAAFHLVYLAKRDGERRSNADDNSTSLFPRRTGEHYLSLGQQLLTAGTSGFTAQLSRPGPANCGALYLGAVLTSYCTFAAGPMSHDDLLVCIADGHGRGNRPSFSSTSPSASSYGMPFVYGVRLMHLSFSPDVLFAGPMAPLKPGSSPPPLQQPVYVRDGFPRLEWESALDGLRAFIEAAAAPRDDADGPLPSSPSPAAAAAAVSLAALDDLIDIYAAVYGRRHSADVPITHNGSREDQFVFGWLYRLQPEFSACVRRREPSALLVLAFYAVLLSEDAVQAGWYIQGWREHLVARVAAFLEDEAVEGVWREWVSWPREQVMPSEVRSA